jgi:multidrug efflux system membrane fusion protein
MGIRFHTTAAVVVLVAAGVWVATGKFSSVGSEIGLGGPASPAEAAAPDTAAPDAAAADTGAGTRDEAGAAAPETLQTVAFITADPAPYERWIRLAGETEADKQVVLVARTSGTVDQLPVSEGDSVSKGDLVMSVEGPERYAALDSANAQLASAANQAEADEELRDRGAITELRYEATVAAREAARSAVQAAQAQVDQLEVDAPFAGTIDKVFPDLGSWVQPGAQVASLLALDPIVVVGELNERDLQSVKTGTRATVTLGDGTTTEGAVRYIRRAATGQTRTFPVEIAIPNPDAAISAGMSAEIRLPVKTGPAVVLPRSAITLDTDGTLGVRLLGADDMVEFLAVDIIDDTPDGLVLSGIAAGTRIIVSGQDMVSDGQKVIAVPAASEQAAE